MDEANPQSLPMVCGLVVAKIRQNLLAIYFESSIVNIFRVKFVASRLQCQLERFPL